MFAIKAELQVNDNARPIYFIIVEGVIIMLFQGNLTSIYDAISMSAIASLTMGQDSPQAAALELDPKLASDLRMSHILIESENMGLLLKFILEKEYPISITFSAEITYNSKPFKFKTLGNRRVDAERSRNNGTIRCTANSDARLYVESKGWFQGNTGRWKECHIALTNIGIFLFDRKQLAASPPEFIWIHELSIETSRSKLEGQEYIARFKQSGEVKWQVSFGSNSLWSDWDKKTTMMQELFESCRGQILFS